MKTFAGIAAAAWARLYPDRRPWNQLESETRAEWCQFVRVVLQLAKEAD